MTFPRIPWKKVRVALDAAFLEQGTKTEVRLRDSSMVLELTAIRGHKRDSTLTDGMTQNGFKVRFLAQDWDAICHRPPEQGDQIVMWGKRHAVETVHILAMGDELLMYVLTMQG